uniref:PX domain-containing protein n=1 Tax=Peronospora matthiolae TaxID=2874970 RepID=A0AAV1UG41_9STRA
MVMQSLFSQSAPAPQRVLHTTIAHVSKPTASSAHTYTQFLVRVSDERSPGLNWAVYRRYSEFRNFKLALEDAVEHRDTCAHCAVMAKRTCFVLFPHRRLFGNLRPKTLETRRIGLNEFLDVVTKHARTCRESMTCQTRPLMDKFLMVNDMRYTYLNVDMEAEAEPSTKEIAGDERKKGLRINGLQRRTSSLVSRTDRRSLGRDEASRSCSEEWTPLCEEHVTDPMADQSQVEEMNRVAGVDTLCTAEQTRQQQDVEVKHRTAPTVGPLGRRNVQHSFDPRCPTAAPAMRQSLTSGWEPTATHQASSSTSRHSDPGLALNELLNFTRGSFSRAGRPHRAESRLRLRKVHLSSAAKRVKKLEEAEARFCVPSQTRLPRCPPKLACITEEN